MKKIALGIDIGGTNTKIALVSDDGDIIDFITVKTASEKGFTHFRETLKNEIPLFLKKNKIEKENLMGIGIGCPDTNGITGELLKPTNLKWKPVNLKAELENALHLKVIVENDANIAALGEGTFGAAKEIQNYVVVTIGTGIGTGVVVNRKLVRGSTGFSCEGGHMAIFQDGRLCGCGVRGHLEPYVNISGLKETVKERTGQDLHFSEIVPLFQNNNKEIKEAIKYSADIFGFALSNITNILTPDMIIITGGGSLLGDSFAQMIDESFNKYIFPTFKGITKIRISKIANEKGAVLGAASLIFNQELF